MNRHSLHKLINARFRDLNKHFRDMQRSVTVDAVHDFRVAVKKLRAILRLISINKEEEIKLPGDLKKVYRKSGGIREWHVLLINNKEHQKFSIFQTNQWRSRIKNESTDLKMLMKNVSVKECRDDILKKIPGRLTRADIIKFFTSKLAEIRHLVQLSKINDELMHTIRKLIKDLLYCAQILQKEMKFRFPLSVWNKDRQLYFSELADAIGDYHDQTVELQMLNQGKKKITDPDLVQRKKQIIDSLKKNI